MRCRDFRSSGEGGTSLTGNHRRTGKSRTKINKNDPRVDCISIAIYKRGCTVKKGTLMVAASAKQGTPNELTSPEARRGERPDNFERKIIFYEPRDLESSPAS